MARPKSPCRTDFEAGLLTVMAEAGISDYSKVSVLAGIPEVTIQRMCSGKYDPRLSTLRKIAAALGCKASELVPD